MTADALKVLQLIFTTVWSFFNGWYIPGTNTTPAQFFLFLTAAFITIRFIKRLVTVDVSGNSKE